MEEQFINLCREGDLDELKQFLQNHPNIDNVTAFCYACWCGHLEFAKWLLHVNPDININISIIEQAFCVACCNGQLELAQWLLHLKPDINISAKNEWVFRETCIHGHLEVVKWLLSVKPDINISVNSAWVFHRTCEKGHLEVAKWLLSMNPDINISYNNDECVFCEVCERGHLEVAKWLLQMKPDINISAKNHRAFIWSYYYKKVEVVKWLQSLKPYLYVIEYDESRKYVTFKIRSKEEANWEKRKYALHMTLKEDINILYHLPKDIAKAVTLFI